MHRNNFVNLAQLIFLRIKLFTKVDRLCLKLKTKHMSILVPLFSALLAAGSFVRIPLGPVAITLQTLFLFMLAILLPPKKALTSVLLYLFLGSIGFPVFTSGGGLACLLGPTGGFLMGMIPASAIGSLLGYKNRNSMAWKVSAILIMNAIMYLFGLSWMMYRLDMSAKSAFIAGCAPFLGADAVKVIAAARITKTLQDDADRILEKGI